MAIFDWLGDAITDTWNNISAGDVADGLVSAGKALSKPKASSASSIVGRGASVGSYINTSNPSPMIKSTPAPIAGLNEGYKPIFGNKPDDQWNYMFRRLLQDNK